MNPAAANGQVPNQNQPVDPSQLSYEQARAELIEVVRGLDSRDIPLESALAMWERGQALAARCQQVLDAARVKVENAGQQ
ncbi:exodeoxyribonuclease VII small subunit [Boudabousia tangfeifanii]|uniref:Exodeoxyribonuclease 7 small subunit n=2 Tax=Boudabousia tangfeifanii TaxID=1912795 RepID=A0A1D9MMH2_9ACTO|nr:exodeoxyribonuclease VII small subunit [Boudabousia tangfeifanii]